MNKQLYRSIQYTNLVGQVKDVYLWPCLVDFAGPKNRNSCCINRLYPYDSIRSVMAMYFFFAATL